MNITSREIFYALMAVALAWGVGRYWLEARVRRRRLAGRARLSDGALYDAFYATSGIGQQFIISAWRQVAKALRVHPGVLRPSDQLRDLKWPRHAVLPTDLDEVVQIALEAASEEDERRPLQIDSIDEVVRFIATRDERRSKAERQTDGGG